MDRISVRRVNEWDAPGMLKIYTHYAGMYGYEMPMPELQSYIQMIDRYTYGMGWIICEVNNIPAGFCYITENADAPDDIYTADIKVYVRPDMLRHGVGTALTDLMTDMMHYQNRTGVIARVPAQNKAAAVFFVSRGFSLSGEKDGPVLKYKKVIVPHDEKAEKVIKPYLIDSDDYERIRAQAALSVKTD